MEFNGIPLNSMESHCVQGNRIESNGIPHAFVRTDSYVTTIWLSFFWRLIEYGKPVAAPECSLWAICLVRVSHPHDLQHVK